MKKRTPKPRNYTVNFNALDEQAKELYADIYQEYDNISIYELREVARRMGVKSATTMDKRTLVTAMTELRVASTVYYPPEKTSVSPVTYKEVEELTNDYLMKSLIINPEQRKGILDLTTDGAWLRVTGFIPDDSDVFVPMLMVNDFKLLSGDELLGQVRFMEKSGRFGMFKLETINGQKADNFKRKHLDNPIPPFNITRMVKGSRMFNTLNTICPLCKGQRYLIIGMNALKLDSLGREISVKLCDKGFETINLFLDESPETMTETISLPGSSLVLSCENFDHYDEAINLAVEYAKRVAPYGRDMALILNNADVLKEETLRAVFGAGRFTGSGSITSVIISSSLELNPVVNRLSRTANSVIIYKNNFTDEPLVDIQRSFSESEKQLDPAEIQTLRDCRKQLDGQYVGVRDFMAAYDILLSGNREQK